MYNHLHLPLIKVGNLLHECTSLPIKITHALNEEIGVMGYNKQLSLDYETYDVFNTFANLSEKTKASCPLRMELKNGQSYNCFSYHVCPNYTVYFIIGPTKCSPNGIHYIEQLFNQLTIDYLPASNPQPTYSFYVSQAITYIHSYYQEPLTLEMLTTHLSLNKCYFCSLFKKETGVTFSYYLNNLRIEKSKELLANASMNILDVAIAAGFNSQNYYTTLFKKFTGLSPVQYRTQYLSF